MDGSRFDTLARSLTAGASRRRFLSCLVAALGLVAMRAPDPVQAKKKNRKNLQRNEFGCVDVGKACRGKDINCCSGICKGKKPKRGRKDTSHCVGHDARTCQAGQNSCVQGAFTGGVNGQCLGTTGKTSFCGSLVNINCAICARDLDCEPAFGPGAACVICAGCSLTGTTACAAPAA